MSHRIHPGSIRRRPAFNSMVALWLLLQLCMVLTAQTSNNRSREMYGTVQRRPDTTVLDIPVTDPAVQQARLATSREWYGKQPPSPPPLLDTAQLGDLQVMIPEQPAVAPLYAYPEVLRPFDPPRPIFAEISGGIYTTGTLTARYSGGSWPYDYSASARLSTTAGHVDGAAASAITAELTGGYIIDEGYGIFSGGYMGACAAYNHRNYHLYALATAPERDLTNWTAAVTGRNTTHGWTYDATGEVRSISLTDFTQISETAVNGTLDLNTRWLGLTIGGITELHLAYLDGASVSTGGQTVYLGYSTQWITLRGGGSLSLGETPVQSRGLLSPFASLQIHAIQGVQLTGEVAGGISQETLGDLLRKNPYVTAQPDIRHSVAPIVYRANLRIEPSLSFGLNLAAQLSDYDTFTYFDQAEQGRFAPQYDAARVATVTGDLLWKFTSQNEIRGMVKYTDGVVGDDQPLPYVPVWESQASYRHTFSSTPAAILTRISYIGDRTLPAGGTLNAAYLIDLEGSYRLSDTFEAFLEFRNLADASYEIWQGYRERGIYGALGIRTRL